MPDLSVEGWTLVVTMIALVVTAVPATLAAVFGYPGWKASRMKPDLRLNVEAGPATSAYFYLNLLNEGTASATDWIVTITMKRGGRFMPEDRNFVGWNDREVADVWVATWMAQGSDDTIGLKLSREVLLAPTVAARCRRLTRSRRIEWMNERAASRSRSATIRIGIRPSQSPSAALAEVLTDGLSGQES
jgi:hypothetical protein